MNRPRKKRGCQNGLQCRAAMPGCVMRLNQPDFYSDAEKREIISLIVTEVKGEIAAGINNF
jgi:hypothetical protein